MRKRGEGLVGRGCCALCFTPFMCARPKGGILPPCPCHTPKGIACGFCGVGLFIILPPDSRIEDITNWLTERRKAA